MGKVSVSIKRVVRYFSQVKFQMYVLSGITLYTQMIRVSKSKDVRMYTIVTERIWG